MRLLRISILVLSASLTVLLEGQMDERIRKNEQTLSESTAYKKELEDIRDTMYDAIKQLSNQIGKLETLDKQKQRMTTQINESLEEQKDKNEPHRETNLDNRDILMNALCNAPQLMNK